MKHPIRRELLNGAVAVLVALCALPPVQAQPLKLILPTQNDALLQGDGPSFYMYTNRYFQGVRSRPWEGGQYGFVRNAKETSEGIVYTRFHEGVDIKPVHRDRRGEPLDVVRTIDDGRIVYVNANEHRSSYGKYVVVEHWWSGAPFYSLYAHLGSVRVDEGQEVRQGDPLGIMGYTGRGIDRTRAHLHFEINMMLSDDFDRWYDRYYRRGRNRHGKFNGINLAGLNVAALYLALKDNPELTIREFIEWQAVYFTVRLPNDHLLDMHYRYPWLAAQGFDREAPSVEVGFTQSGLPVRIEASYRRADEPVVADVRYSTVSYAYLTNHLSGYRSDPELSGSGGRYVNLLALETDRTRSGAPPVAVAEAQPPLPPVKRVETKPVQIQVQADVPETVQVGFGWSGSGETSTTEGSAGGGAVPISGW